MHISPAMTGDHEWCAEVMSTTDPWIRLGRDYRVCLERCSHPEYLLLIAREDDGRRRGFVLIHPRGLAGAPYIAAIAVADDARGEGVGSFLLDAAERAVPGSRHLFLLVSSFNTRARDLYLRRGFVQVGEIPDYAMDGASELILHKRLVAR